MNQASVSRSAPRLRGRVPVAVGVAALAFALLPNVAVADPPTRAVASTVPTGTSSPGAVVGPSLTAVEADGAVVVQSPDRATQASVAAVGGQLTYSISRRGEVVVGDSALGLDLAGRPSLTEDMSIESVERRSIDETWKPLWGADAQVRNRAQELTIHAVQETTGFRLDVIMRVFDDGVGFRYHFPEQAGLDDYTVTAERTEFALDPESTAWSLAAGNDWRADERHYREGRLATVSAAQTPITLETPSRQYVVVHEADLTDYPSMTLKATPERPGSFRSELISLPDGSKAKLSGEFSTPWRTLTIGDRAGDLAESHLIENLNDPCAICEEDTDWIKPATYVGVWWELQRRATTWTAGPTHGATTARVKEYVDLAQRAGSKFVLAEGWNTNAGGSWSGQDFTTPRDDFDLEEVLAYAEERGIGFIAHNETRGNVDYYDENLERIFSRYEELGITAIKTGYATKFVLGGVNRSTFDQEAVRHFQRVIDAAARHGITINAHEAIKPTGLARTYPNMMTGEGVAGMEQQNYKGANGNPPAQASILPFTRFMGGPADYTPGVLNVTWDPANLGTRVQTTSTAQLALYTTFFSPLQMLADTPENYAESDGFSYLQDMPATWDETRVLSSEIGDYVTTARRSGEDWYLGSITDENARTLKTPLRFLDAGTRYVAEIYADAEETTWKGNPLPIEVTKVLVRSSTKLTASMVGGGGYAVRLKPATREDIRSLPAYRAPKADSERPDAVLTSSPEGGSQVLEVDVALTNRGSTATDFPAQVSIDRRPVGTADRVRIAGGGTRTFTFRIDATEIPDDDFRVSVDVAGGSRGPSTKVEQPRSMGGTLSELRREKEVSASAAKELRARLARAERELRRGDVTGRLMQLQELRLDLYGFDQQHVSLSGRQALDDVLSLRLGSPEGIVALAQQVRQLRDTSKATETLAHTLIQRIGRAARAASQSDAHALDRHLQELSEAVDSASDSELDQSSADQLLARIEALRAPALVTEAETMTLLDAACLRTNHVDYTGTGFVACLKTPGDGVRLENVTGDGSYDMTIRYANAMGSTRTMTVTTDTTSTRTDFANLPTWDDWSKRSLQVTLTPGDDVTVFYGPGDNGNINIDSITLKPRLGVVTNSAT